MSRKLFVNLAVEDLERSKSFFAGLGFSFNPQFTNEHGACMIISDEASVMLLTKPFFQGFTKQKICDTQSHNEALLCVSCDSRADVDAMVKTAMASGGKPAMPAQDHGFMYGHSFYDVDGHHWEVMWMDPKAAP